MKAKFTLRDLLAIITIAAMALGWWVDHRRLVRSEAKLLVSAENLRNNVRFLASVLSDNGYEATFTEDGFAAIEPDDETRRRIGHDVPSNDLDQPTPSN